NNAKEPGASGSSNAGQIGTFTITRSGDLTGSLTVGYTINNYQAAHLAALGQDFNYTVDSSSSAQTASSGTITVGSNVDTVVFHIHPQYNAQVESDENVYLSLVASTSSAYLLGSRPTAHIKIIDNGEHASSPTESVGVVVTDFTTNEIQHVQL